MQCVVCKQDNDRVVDSRSCGNGEAIRRRRECLSCGRRFTTYERAEIAARIVIKKDGRRELFCRDKVLQGIRIACQKRPVSSEQLTQIVDHIEADLFGDSDREVHTREIGEKVIEGLNALDKVAYVRFASVYREFADVGEFVDALLPFLRGEALLKLQGGGHLGNGACSPGAARSDAALSIGGRRTLIKKDGRNGNHPGSP